MHQITPFLKKILEGHAPEPPIKAHGFDMQISKAACVCAQLIL